MKLIYQGSDILRYVSVNKLVCDMFAEGRSDVLSIRFNDSQSLWERWDPQIGDPIEFEEESLQTRRMYISEIAPEDGLYSVRAVSMPPECKAVNNKSWEEVKFSQLCKEIAGRHSMECQFYDMPEITYPYMVQDNVNDLEFLQRRCELEGCAMLAYNRKIVIYDERSQERKAASGTLSIGLDGAFKYTDDSTYMYKAAEVKSGGYSGRYEASGVNTSRIFIPNWPIHVNSNAEAARYAKNLLRLVNKEAFRGVIERYLTFDYTPASVANLETVRAKTWNGKVFITRVRHDFMESSTKIYFRKPLEGY